MSNFMSTGASGSGSARPVPIALVTGGSGFIGSRLIEDLQAKGIEVRALLRKTSSLENLKALNPALWNRVEGDLSDRASLERACAGVDYVFHLAGAITAPNRDGFFRHNSEGTRNLIEAAAKSAPALKRFVFVSSLAAGGPVDSVQPRFEGMPDQPVSAYGESKLQAEREVLKFKDRLPISIIRPPMVYGPKDKATFLFVKTVSRNYMPIFGASLAEDGKKRYSTIHVWDLSQGIVQAGLHEAGMSTSGEIYYLCGDEVITYEELMETIAEFLGKKPRKIHVPNGLLRVAAFGLSALGTVTRRTFPLNRDKLSEIEPDFWICVNTKAKERFGFKPQFSFRAGMENAVRWYRENGWVRS